MLSGYLMGSPEQSNTMIFMYLASRISSIVFVEMCKPVLCGRAAPHGGPFADNGTAYRIGSFSLILSKPLSTDKNLTCDYHWYPWLALCKTIRPQRKNLEELKPALDKLCCYRQSHDIGNIVIVNDQ